MTTEHNFSCGTELLQTGDKTFFAYLTKTLYNPIIEDLQKHITDQNNQSVRSITIVATYQDPQNSDIIKIEFGGYSHILGQRIFERILKSRFTCFLLDDQQNPIIRRTSYVLSW
jgi:hypothetical protein